MIPCTRGGRRGFAAVIVIVVFVICMSFFALWAKSAVIEHRRATTREWRLQAARLAEAGLLRAARRLAADPGYEGETWSIPAEDLKQQHAADVRLRAVRGDLSIRIEATARYPAGAVRRAQVTRQMTVPSPTEG
jgi:type II secretory pathway component PulK